MTKRSGSNTRRRAISRPVRLTAEEDQEIRKRAAECGKTVSGFLRAAALGKKVNSLTDDRVLKEVMRLGALQKKLFIDGKRVGDREYAEVLIAIYGVSPGPVIQAYGRLASRRETVENRRYERRKPTNRSPFTFIHSYAVS